ncbi:MAG TPA: DUF5060 domain-containing protein [Verrucomicrobiae bacterium]|nr:DUF5060 domain-containing protein [Verrucomicrobiae bacterium]
MIRKIILTWCIAGIAALVASATDTVEQWGMYEVALPGPTNGNPFLDVKFAAQFKQGDVTITADGFYDGDGTYRVRFMPEKRGEWHYETMSGARALNGKKGRFTVVKPAADNHGPVQVTNTFHFAYADGSPYKELGTTCYVWHLQDEALQEETLRTLAASPFNKIRFCVFPKRYTWNTNEPILYPFAGNPATTNWGFSQFNVKYFQHLEQRVADLQKLGIEADIILFHPYDEGHWGFDRMPAAVDDRYLHYVVARLAAYHNVWWSLANEYDFMKEKKESDFVRFGEIVSHDDPYHHLLSIHNGQKIFNQTLPWITHASIQNGAAVEEPGRAEMYRDVYRKPIVYDEVKYEGNIENRWGQLSAEELVFRFWNGTVAGTYVGHGETYKSDDQVLWWSKGGVLKGRSPARLAFLKKVLDDAPPEGIEPIDKWQNPEYGGKAPEYYLVYLGKQTPTNWEFKLPKPPQGKGQPPAEGMKFTVEVLDTWNMTVTPVGGVFTLHKKDGYFYGDKDRKAIELPGRPYMAIRIKRVKD